MVKKSVEKLAPRELSTDVKAKGWEGLALLFPLGRHVKPQDYQDFLDAFFTIARLVNYPPSLYSDKLLRWGMTEKRSPSSVPRPVELLAKVLSPCTKQVRDKAHLGLRMLSLVTGEVVNEAFSTDQRGKHWRKQFGSDVDKPMFEELYELLILSTSIVNTRARIKAKSFIVDIIKRNTSSINDEKIMTTLRNYLSMLPHLKRQEALPLLSRLFNYAHVTLDELTGWDEDRRGQHWKTKRGDDKKEMLRYHVAVRGAGSWKVTTKQLLGAVGLKTQNALELRISKGGGKAVFRLSDEIYTVTSLPQSQRVEAPPLPPTKPAYVPPRRSYSKHEDL